MLSYAFLYRLISELIQAGSSGLIRVFLLGMHSFAIITIWFDMFWAYLLISASYEVSQFVSEALSLRKL